MESIETEQDFFTNLIEGLLFYMIELNELKDEDRTIQKLQDSGFQLIEIDTNGFSVVGSFKNKNFNKDIQVPYYKIHEDILIQLEVSIEEYYSDKISSIDDFFIDKNEINWHKIYKSEGYNKLYFITSIELLYSKLDNFLKNHS